MLLQEVRRQAGAKTLVMLMHGNVADAVCQNAVQNDKHMLPAGKGQGGKGFAMKHMPHAGSY